MERVDGVGARTVGAFLLAVPLAIGLAVSFFPSYDARSRYFVSTFPNIVAAGDRYLVALILFGGVAAIIVMLAMTLSRSQLRNETSALSVTIGGLVVAACGFTVAAGTGVPAWLWARHAADGSEPMREMALRSQAWASTSQTVLLMFGLGGLLISMSVLGVSAVTHRWIPKLLFWGSVGAALALIVGGAAVSGPVIWLAIGWVTDAVGADPRSRSADPWIVRASSHRSDSDCPGREIRRLRWPG